MVGAYDAGLVSEVVPRLWQGGTPEGWNYSPINGFQETGYGRHFDSVVTLYDGAPPFARLVPETRFCFADARLESDQLHEISAAALWGYERWVAGDDLLVRCQAGWNRSGLVTGLILIRSGMEPEEAVSKIRAKRGPMALSNYDFANHLLRFSGSVLH